MRPNSLTLNGINRRGGPQQTVKFWLLVGERVRIWSQEHQSYWRANAQGYTRELAAAGIYDFEDAYARTKHCGPEKMIHYHRVATPASPSSPETTGE
jgi:hypothetical protein